MNEMTKYRLILEAAETDPTHVGSQNVEEVLAEYPPSFAQTFHELIDDAILGADKDNQNDRIFKVYDVLRHLMSTGHVDNRDMSKMRDTIIQAMEDKGFQVIAHDR